jgi:hypothetical protein
MMFLSSISETWVAIAESLEYGWGWLADNFTNALKYTFYIVTSGSVLTGVGYFIKVGLPILKHINNPTIAKLNEIMKKNNITEEKLNKTLETVTKLKDENATLKEYVALATEANKRNITLTKDMQEKFGYLSKKLKETNNQKAIDISNKIDNVIEDEQLTDDEIVNLAEEIPEVEETLGMSIDDIKLEMKGE